MSSNYILNKNFLFFFSFKDIISPLTVNIKLHKSRILDFFSQIISRAYVCQHLLVIISCFLFLFRI